MRAVPMAPILATSLGAERTVIIGEPGMSPADEGAPMPAEYAVTASTLYPGRPCFHALLVLSRAEREAIAAGDGAMVLLTLDGAEVPWQVSVVTEQGPRRRVRFLMPTSSRVATVVFVVALLALAAMFVWLPSSDTRDPTTPIVVRFNSAGTLTTP